MSTAKASSALRGYKCDQRKGGCTECAWGERVCSVGMAPQNDFGLVWWLFFFFMFAEAYGGKQDESQKMSSIMARHQQGFVGNRFLSGVMKLRVTLLHCRLPQHQSHDKTLGDNQPSPAASRQTRSGLPYYRSSRSLQAHGPGRRQHPPAAP